MTSIGRLRHRITIQQASEADDGQGGSTTTWGTLATVWADETDTGGKEFQSAKQVVPTLSTQFKIRYRAGITAAMRVLKGSDIYRIAAPPIDKDGRQREMLLFCESIAGETP